MQQQQGVVLRIKRRRDVQAPEQIVLEATSRTSALLSEFQRSVNIASDSDVVAEAQVAAGPPTKRCRFVLLKQDPQDAHVSQQQTPHQQQAQWLQQQTAGNSAAAAAAGLPAGNRVLDLWHSSGLGYTPANAAAAAAAAGSSVMGGRTKQQQQLSGLSAAAAAAGNADQLGPRHTSAEETKSTDLQKSIQYEDMVQQYLQQQQHDPAAAAASVRRTNKPPSRRAARSARSSSAAAGDTLQPQQKAAFLPQQQQQQSAHLPEDMTRDTQQQIRYSPQATQLAPSAAAAAAAGEAAQGSSNNMLVDDSEDPEYVYDGYVPVYDDSVVEDTHLYQQQQQGSQGTASTVVQLWEEDLVGFEDLWAAPLGSAVAAEDDEEDSNAEHYYGNDYPDDEDHHHFEADTEADSDRQVDNVDNVTDSSDSDHDSPHKFDNTHTSGQHNSLITCYKPKSNKSSNMPAGVNDGADTEEYDINDYESSGDEEQLQGWYNSGAAWRAVLAEQCMLQDSTD